ncbi:MAG: hypothetical protein IT195_12530 [Microthrixaceae bacterium]|nr:hypothetical protein [Microthrixaceae bacterium]
MIEQAQRIQMALVESPWFNAAVGLVVVAAVVSSVRARLAKRRTKID